VAKKALDKVQLTAGEKGLRLISQYAKNGREAVNIVQIGAGLAINEGRNFIKDDDIEWIIHSSRLAPRVEKRIHGRPEVGLVNGMAVYGASGGTLLEIEATVIPAVKKGTVNITGIVEEESIGEQGKSVRRKSLVKSSIENAITVLRTFGVPADEYDIHVNFPGGMPVDGPSAGVALASAIYSAIYKIPVDNRVAMTGEISVHGKVKPVGGIYEKVRAAKKAGAKKVIVPKGNDQALLKNIDGVEIVPVETITEVFKHAFPMTGEKPGTEVRDAFSAPDPHKKTI
jgi:Lon-like ATP-dependent protease